MHLDKFIIDFANELYQNYVFIKNEQNAFYKKNELLNIAKKCIGNAGGSPEIELGKVLDHFSISTNSEEIDTQKIINFEISKVSYHTDT